MESATSSDALLAREEEEVFVSPLDAREDSESTRLEPVLESDVLKERDITQPSESAFLPSARRASDSTRDNVSASAQRISRRSEEDAQELPAEASTSLSSGAED